MRTTHVHNTKLGQYAIRLDNWLLVDADDGYVSGRNKPWEKKHEYPADDGGPVELYDLSTDKGQRNNVASGHPAIVKKLQALLKKIREQGHSAPGLEK